MNSKQRRGLRRRFKHMIPIHQKEMSVSDWLDRIHDMDQWCRYRYGRNSYRYAWQEVLGPMFGFKTESDKIEFAMMWC